MPLPVMPQAENDDATTYSTADVCRLVGVSFRMVDYWIRREVIRPSVEARGAGTHRRFIDRDVVEVRVAVGLRRLGVGLDEIADVLGTVRAAEPGDLILWNGETARAVAYDGENLADVIRAYGGTAVVAVVE